jgi:hypothetical protein
LLLPTELRKRHYKERLVTIYKSDQNPDLGSKHLDEATTTTTTAVTAPAPSGGSSNTTLPFTLRELGLEKTTDEYHRRVLQATVSSGAAKCTIRRNVTLHGGHLPHGPRRIKDIPNRK